MSEVHCTPLPEDRKAAKPSDIPPAHLMTVAELFSVRLCERLEAATAPIRFPVWFVMQDSKVVSIKLTEAGAKAHCESYTPRTGGTPYIVATTAVAEGGAA